MRPGQTSRAVSLAALAATLATQTARPALAEGPAPALAAALPAEATPAPADALSGEAIYDLVLSNRFESFDQSLEMISGDRGGNTETVKMEVKYKNFRPESKKILSKSIALYEAPQDVRYMGYLVVNKMKGTSDQFVYRPSARRVRRVNLRGESVVGTDFSLEDIIPRELEDASYNRLPDETREGREVYVVEVRPDEESNSEYSKFVAYVDKESHVALHNLYWDKRGVLFKELTAVVDSITKYEGDEGKGTKTVWVAKQSKVENTRLESFTMLMITRLVANPKLGGRDFTERRLAQGH